VAVASTLVIDDLIIAGTICEQGWRPNLGNVTDSGPTTQPPKR
jgi:hypothetical protein